MEQGKFQCLQCGHCCSHLVGDSDWGRLGMCILPEERKWFPRNAIFPLYGVGLKGRRRPRPREIIAYQLAYPVCPWFNKEKVLCINYKNRPLACRSYPMRLGDLDGECRFVITQSYKDEVILDPDSLTEEIAADKRLQRYIDQTTKGQICRIYPLDTRRWVRMNRDRFR